MSDDPLIRISVPRPAAETGTGKRKPTGLGRGLGALLGETRREEAVPSGSSAAAGEGSGEPEIGGLAALPVAAIEPHPEQPRRHFEEAALDELAASIAARGVIQPVIVKDPVSTLERTIWLVF